MENFQNVLMKFGAFAGQNKYLRAIKNAFQIFMPFTIIGAIGVLWSNVICNSDTGLGALWSPIMKLSFLNPAFNALNFATIGCITVAITVLIGAEIGEEGNNNKVFCGLLALISLLTITQTSMEVMYEGTLVQTVNGIFNSSLGSQGLFTGMIIAISSIELFVTLFKVNWLKIKLPEQVPAQIAKSFEYLIPAFITILLISIVGLLIKLLSGFYANDLIFNLVQQPLLNIGGSLPGILIFIFVSCLFWSIGLHGDNMIGGVLEPIVTTLMVQNLEAVQAGLQPTNIINYSFHRTFMATGGTGCMLSLTLAILLVSKRAENKSIGRLALVPNLFNIGEVNMFGVPVVLNPILIIPFIIAPLASVIFGYLMTSIGICPIMYIQVPWTMPPFLMGFLASGGSIMAGICQLLAICLGILIFIPFIKIYEKQQKHLDEQSI